MSAIRLGLIGGNIAASQSPALHRIAGELCGLDVSYELLTPGELGKSFDGVFEDCARAGFRGVNVTYPFKEEVTARVVVDDPVQAAIGSCNTVVFDAPHHAGANTDYSGFIKAFRRTFGEGVPGHVAVAGAGGVGKAIAFALAALGADFLAIYDTDRLKAESLRAALKQSFPALPSHVATDVEEAMEDAEGLVNCTPLGMDKIGGSAFPATRLDGQMWAFDAVYTPVETPFVEAARGAGLWVMTGYELFLYQGIDAFRIFTGIEVDARALREALSRAGEPARQSA
jgi:shikimate dehydrogenase